MPDTRAIDPYVERFIRRKDYAYKTGQNGRYTLDRYSIFLAERGIDSVLEADDLDVEDFIAKRRAEGLKESTIAVDYRFLAALYKFAKTHDAITSNPMTGLTAPKADAQPSVPRGDEDDFATFISNTNAHHYEDRRARAMFALMFDAGMRASEVCGLRLGELDLSEGTIEVNRTKSKRDRVSLLTPRGDRYLEAWLQVRVGSDDPDAPVFTGNAGTKARNGAISYSGWCSYLRRYRARTGHEMQPAHAWRRAAVERYILAGVDQYAIETLFGWKHDGRMYAQYLGHRDQVLAIDAARAAFAGSDEREDRRTTRARKAAERRLSGDRLLKAV